LESDLALVQASSGLERLMVSDGKAGPVKESMVVQISAFLYYQANVMNSLHSNKAFHKMFRDTLFRQIDKDFGEYVDAQARMKPKSLHHVYEWDKAGIPGSRLFSLSTTGSDMLSFGIKYSFKMSKSAVPSRNKKQRRRYVFKEKARIMESGMPVVISPKSAERLVFELDGQTIFMPKGASVTVKSPGGKASSNQFGLMYSRFFASDLVNSSIKRSGFNNIFNAKIAKALQVPTSIKKIKYSFSPNVVRKEADMAVAQAFGGGAL
jgi:hypothetical protein